MKQLNYFFLLVITILLYSIIHCKKEEEKPKNSEEKKTSYNMGVGPVQTKLDLGALDANLAKKGQKIFEEKCTACHKIEERYVGPSLKDVTKRRTPEWIMNMILDPMKMTAEDPDAKALLAEYLTQMTNQNISLEDARAILEYFRLIDNK
ncbi:MAG: c-type cytochrome [Leptonema sp. (in: bacteria)]